MSAIEKSGAGQPRLKCVSWNIHRARGTDGIVDPDRIKSAIRDAIAPNGFDVLALQEADEECRPHGRIIDVEGISEDTGFVYQHAEDKMRWGPASTGFLGTILFLHPRLEVTYRDVLDLPGHCHRGAVVVEALAGSIPFRVISMHLSLSQVLRVAQMRIIGQFLMRRPAMQTVMLGDFNEWRPWGGMMFHKGLFGRKMSGPVRCTFPSRFPVLPLDRIMSDVPHAVQDVQVETDTRLRTASDHLPISGTVML